MYVCMCVCMYVCVCVCMYVCVCMCVYVCMYVVYVYVCMCVHTHIHDRLCKTPPKSFIFIAAVATLNDYTCLLPLLANVHRSALPECFLPTMTSE